MIDAETLLTDLQRLLERLVRDLRERAAELPELDAKLRAEHAAARDARRTAETLEEWREEALTQAGVHWILACVFVRFLEDNHFVDRPYLSGPGERLTLARDRHTRFFQAHPTETDREYLLDVFREVAALPGAAGLYDERHNPIGWIGLSGDGARELLEFWQRVDPDTGALAHDFTDPDAGTRFLGDLYQDLSAFARKRYALLQTPEFVEEFILDRTLTPAIETFGYREVRLIDPTCGSGHFVLGAFRRLFDLHVRHEPATNPRELAQRALDQVAGVDVNPFATAIARFRLWIAALRACGVTRLADAPAFKLHLATGDSLLHGRRFRRLRGRTLDERPTVQLSLADDSVRHVYLVEDRADLDRILGRPYHAVVGNPPYITVKDRALNQAYRDRFESCHRQYSLAVPFMERFFELASGGTDTDPAGFVGMITANSFMKREFGKKLIEEFIPTWDLTHVIDTSGAYIPGHGTPTVILFGRNQSPLADTVRAVLGIRGEPSTPDDPAHGLVWQAILRQLDDPGSESEFVSVADSPRETFLHHPWSLGGGGAAQLRQMIGGVEATTLSELIQSVGFYQDTHADEAFVQPASFVRRFALESGFRRQVRGEDVRDWVASTSECILFPYDAALAQWSAIPTSPRWSWLWSLRTLLWSRSTFSGNTYRDEGRVWFDYHQFPKDRARASQLIGFAFIATHNHFVLDREQKVFNRSAPVIKLMPDATEDDHLALLGLLNSSAACFWMKQVCHNKGATSDRGVLQADPTKFRFEFDGTKLRGLPVPEFGTSTRGALIRLTRALDAGGTTLAQPIFASPAVIETHTGRALRARLDAEIQSREALRRRMVRWQEEVDWLVYEAYDLMPPEEPPRSRIWSMDPDEMPELEADQRPFHGAESPALDAIDRARASAISSNPAVAMLESGEFKRRWFRSAGAYDDRNLTDEMVLEVELHDWLLDRLEDPHYWSSGSLTSCARLAELVRHDAEFMKVGEALRGTPDFDVTALVTELALDEAVPFLPVLRYKESGLRKRAQWERTWERQRQEDAIDARGLSEEDAKAAKRAEVGEIPVPPKYTSADFTKGSYWRLRGKLDVPKERFILYPHAERAGDDSPVLAWAGWDHLQQAKALATHYLEMKEQEGWPPERLTPLLAGLIELEPWLLQWHNALDPAYGIGMGDYYRDFIDTELRTLGLTRDQAKAWIPPANPRGGRRGRRNAK